MIFLEFHQFRLLIRDFYHFWRFFFVFLHFYIDLFLSRIQNSTDVNFLILSMIFLEFHQFWLLIRDFYHFSFWRFSSAFLHFYIDLFLSKIRNSTDANFPIISIIFLEFYQFRPLIRDYHYFSTWRFSSNFCTDLFLSRIRNSTDANFPIISMIFLEFYQFHWFDYWFEIFITFPFDDFPRISTPTCFFRNSMDTNFPILSLIFLEFRQFRFENSKFSSLFQR